MRGGGKARRPANAPVGLYRLRAIIAGRTLRDYYERGATLGLFLENPTPAGRAAIPSNYHSPPTVIPAIPITRHSNPLNRHSGASRNPSPITGQPGAPNRTFRHPPNRHSSPLNPSFRRKPESMDDGLHYRSSGLGRWIPACAGMTVGGDKMTVGGAK